ncbi:ankyrin repeat domain-containing protein 39 [Hemicordylus capensis]|uniref:ankyrin repeat domain-containing protein 39 n=1 Tax=Hemicordylus capensis TaxID=884348 RepID=UPI002303921C|nr:ankyrin repeat domain-containing protein 39 [Hemicordylus capensis]XP_053126289.1 ankyrin repeat domain-containing protein 39 [Hemicordylus capensis]XP_053126290.1 ankyrin repeat domain-containing protein 39 [Hemicordylus capensis]XP_053126291.1 ankyrin repeat domain-containing protein 39 [Hemicordylus capensis]XP_053126293.1 ankyrin repeat domain-containing protein 39 [Hemicordylus capensis]XP_053126294.1 ankyrin repeat domain-containing protein 39 [Hemicordylus capensis]XP_053126295.1 an
MATSSGHSEEDGGSCSHHRAAPSVHQTLEEMDFERGIWCAALNGDLQRVQMQIRNRGKPSEPDPLGYTALHYASRNGHYDVCRFLLESGALCNAQTHGGATPLHRASYCGHTEVAKLLLAHGADPATTDDDGKTSLHKAAENGHLDLCDLLLEQNPDLRLVRDKKLRRACDLVPEENKDLRELLDP